MDEPWDLRWHSPVGDVVFAAVHALTRSPRTALVVQDEAGRIVAANRAAEAALGLTWDQMIGRTSSDARWQAVSESGLPLSGDDHPAMVALRSGQPVHDVVMGVVLPPVAGLAAETRWLSVDATPLIDDRRTVGVLAEFMVVTDGARARAAAQAPVAARGEQVPAEAPRPGAAAAVEARRTRQQLAELGGRLDRERVRLKRAMAAAQLGIWEWEESTGRVAFDDRLGAILGRSGLDSLTAEEWRGLIASDPLDPSCDPSLGLADRTVDQVDVTTRMRSVDGADRWVRIRGEVTARGDHGEVVRVFGTLEDVTEATQVAHALADSEAHYRLLAENMTDAVWQVTPDGVIAWASESTEGLLGWLPSDVVGHEALSYLHPEDLGRGLTGRGHTRAGRGVVDEGALRRADGTYRMVAITARPVVTPQGIWEILAFRDIQGEVDAREAAVRAAERDALTGLPNRVAALEEIKDRLRRHRVAILLVGVDGLQTVNQAWSFAAGDNVISAVARRVADTLPDGAFLARGPSDDLIVVLPSGAGDPADLAERLLEVVRQPLTLGEITFEPTASIGIADPPDDADAAALLRDAAVALQRAKAAGRDRFEFSDAAVAAAAHERLRIAAETRAALRAGAITCCYQPIVELATEKVVGYEALVRAPGTSLETPEAFLPLAESSGLVVEIDIAVLEAAAATLAGLPDDVFVAVNASARSIGDARYVGVVTRWLVEEPGLRGRLHIELTETAILSITDGLRDVVTELAAAGVRWFADDFGTGYSSIAHLRDLPIAGLKLDRSFTEALTGADDTADRLSKAMAALAAGMGLMSVAEGVETAAQASILAAHGWRLGQGWLFGRPEAVPRTIARSDRAG